MHTTQPFQPSLITIALTTCLLSWSTAPQAQQADPAEAQPMEHIAVTGHYTVNEVIDTATGLGLTLQETPQSVTVFTQQRILDQNLDTIADVVTNVPGVSVNEVDDVRNTFNARGFEINNYQVDGIPLAYTLAGGAGETILDAALYERIEVVRGATGLLTGVGDPSASVNLVRKHANSDQLTGQISGRVGRWNNMQVNADIAGALNQSGTVRARAVAKYEQGESQVNLFEDQKIVLYGVIEHDFSQTTRIRAGMSHQEQKPESPAWGALPSWYSDGTFTHFPRSQTSSADWTFWDTTNQNIFATVSHEFNNGWRLEFNYNWLRNAQQTEILYLFGTVDKTTGTGLGSFPYSDDGDNTQNSIDIQLTGEYSLFARDHEFVTGLLISKQHYQNDTFAALSFPVPGNYFDLQDGSYPYPGFSGTPLREVDMDTRQEGLYGATRLHLSEDVKAIVGARLSNWDREGINFSPAFDFGDNGVFTPYAGLLWDLVPNHSVYLSYTEIFQPQNAQDKTGQFLDPIVGKSTEAGLKSRYLDGALHTSLAIFRIEQDNLAQVDPGQFIPGTPFEASIATEGATSEGFEAELLGRLTENWNIGAGYSYFNATDANGNEVNTDHPRKLFNLFTTYQFSGQLAGLTVGSGINWQGEMFSNTVNPVTGESFRLSQQSYALINLMARYALTETLTLQANIDNLTDKTYFSQVGFFDQYRYGEARNYSVSLSYQF